MAPFLTQIRKRPPAQIPKPQVRALARAIDDKSRATDTFGNADNVAANMNDP
jgi:hypothetical protein